MEAWDARPRLCLRLAFHGVGSNMCSFIDAVTSVGLHVPYSQCQLHIMGNPETTETAYCQFALLLSDFFLFKGCCMGLTYRIRYIRHLHDI